MSRAEQLVREYELACQAYEMTTGTTDYDNADQRFKCKNEARKTLIDALEQADRTCRVVKNPSYHCSACTDIAREYKCDTCDAEHEHEHVNYCHECGARIIESEEGK